MSQAERRHESSSMRMMVLLALAFIPSLSTGLSAQQPTGLAAAALADSSFRWIPRDVPGFRAYFLVDSYPARNQDSLLARLPPAVRHAERLINAPPSTGTIDLFFIETREQMTRLIGGRATGFAQPSARAVFLVTNPAWRAFERHEIMHVVAGQAWGPPAPNTEWLVEGLAQAADGQCAGRSNTDVLLALTARHGWIPLTTLLTAFRTQLDLRAYLQAAAFVDYLLAQADSSALRELWRRGATPESRVGGESLEAHARRWRDQVRSSWRPTAEQIDHIEASGCG
jgi:hypothetical protein